MFRYRLINQDAETAIDELSPSSVQCVITSPPYYMQRDYGVSGQLGQEDTPERFIARLASILDKLKRPLRDDGTMWVNLGDKYGPDKNLMCLPWLLALRMKKRGWVLRDIAIWAKKNAAPDGGGVRDRMDTSYEPILFFAKRKTYYYDQEAIREPLTTPEKRTERIQYEGKSKETSQFRPPNRRGKNKRNVLHLACSNSSLAHFAPFPEALVKPLLLASTSEYGACPECGAPYKRIIDVTGETNRWGDAEAQRERNKEIGRPGTGGCTLPPGSCGAPADAHTVGWEPTCGHEPQKPVPCHVLDPFAGTSTTGVVALKHGRCYTGIELNDKYVQISEERLRKL